MLPTGSNSAVFDSIWMNSKFPGKFSRTHSLLSKLPYFFHFLFGEQCVTSLRSFFTTESPFTNTILSIVFVRSYEKVIRVAAFAVVAFMAYAKTFWNWTLLKNISYPVSQTFFSKPISSRISAWISFSLRRPAFVWATNINSHPESNIPWRCLELSDSNANFRPFRQIFMAMFHTGSIGKVSRYAK